ncbi:MAG: PDZ domain-containing protein, partial [Blastocatellia bacterium]
MSKRARILLGAILLALMSAYFGVYIYSLSLPNQGSDDGWRGTWAGRGDPIITDLVPNGWAAGLRVGDEIIAINGIKIKDDPRILDYNSSAPPGTRYTMTIRRAGELRDVEIQTVPVRIKFDPLYYISLLFLLTGWIVFLLRPDDKQAWLLAVMLGSMMGLGNDPANLPSWLSLIVGAAGAVELLSLPIFVHFFLIFPDPSPLLRRWARLETWLYLPCLLVILPTFALFRLSGDAGLLMFRFQWFGYLTLATSILIIAYLAAGLACLVINYRAASLIARRRLRVVMTGSAAGFFNIFLLVVGGQAGLQGLMPALWPWIGKSLFITLPLIPLSFVYAIVRHKVIPVSLIIRRGMRYLLVSRGAEILEAIAVGSLIIFLFRAIFSYWQVTGVKAGVIATIVAVLLWDYTRKLHKRFLAPLIDRRFFRQSYNSQRIISELTGSLRTVTDLPQLLELVATKLRTALQTEYVTIYLRDPATGSFNNAYSSDYSKADGAVVNRPHSGQLAMYARMAEQLDQLEKSLERAEPLRPGQRQSDNREQVEIEPDFLSAYDGDVMLAEEREALREVKATLL